MNKKNVLKIRKGTTLLILCFATYACLSLFPEERFLSFASFRKAPELYCRKTFFRTAVCLRTHQAVFEPFFRDPEKFFSEPHEFLKEEPSRRTVILIKIGGRSYVVKKYNYARLDLWLQRLPFFASPGMRAFFYGRLLPQEGIRTAEPVLYMEKNIGPLWTECYLVTVFIDAPSANTFFSSSKNTSEERAEILYRLRKDLSVLDRLHTVHRDLRLTNILIHDHYPYLIDLDDMQKYSSRTYRKKAAVKHTRKLIQELAKVDPESSIVCRKLFKNEISEEKRDLL